MERLETIVECADQEIPYAVQPAEDRALKTGSVPMSDLDEAAGTQAQEIRFREGLCSIVSTGAVVYCSNVALERSNLRDCRSGGRFG